MKCGCCGKELKILGVQTWPPQLNRPSQALVECENKRCIAYKRTSTTETHHEICADAKKEAQS